MTPRRRRRARLSPSRPTEITSKLLRRWPLPKPDGARGKDGRGSVLVVGGCLEIPGAVILSGQAALRVGAGRLQIATARSVAVAVGVAVPEARVVGVKQRPNGEIHVLACRALRKDFQRHDAVLVGPGMGPQGAAAAGALLNDLDSDGKHPPMVVDAGGLAALHSRNGTRRGLARTLIATPHAGEMARIWDVSLAIVEANPLEIARQAARQLGTIVVLKGEVTYVAAPDGSSFVNRAGTAGLGTSGSGDVLAGIIAGLCARGADPIQAAVWAAFTHAKAGEAIARRIGPLGFLARELLDELPSQLSTQGGPR
jgi:ADP-dependent NAD(P)H-hydrate dehydratase